MKFELWWIGKTNDKYLVEGIKKYEKKIPHYFRFSIVEIKDVKVSPKLKLDESTAFQNKLKSSDYVILLDEKGESFTSRKWAGYLERLLNNSGFKRIIFIIAGAFGADPSLKNRANLLLSFSHFTMSHQMIRLVFLEQLYRAGTIIKNEKYHND